MASMVEIKPAIPYRFLAAGMTRDENKTMAKDLDPGFETHSPPLPPMRLSHHGLKKRTRKGVVEMTEGEGRDFKFRYQCLGS